ncbi:hypothetical protein BaRGS_00031304 [Batillaria attramentaria]|uniref:Uncharacterized protein n=1 Tax=Batillaria attramentaria TaxID=370345 RepID=A0ABD0JS32_9CAEN
MGLKCPKNFVVIEKKRRQDAYHRGRMQAYVAARCAYDKTADKRGNNCLSWGWACQWACDHCAGIRCKRMCESDVLTTKPQTSVTITRAVYKLGLECQ